MDDAKTNASLKNNTSLKATLTAGTGTQTIKEIEKDYTQLINRPKINGVELIGNVPPESLDVGEALTNMEIEALIQGLQL